MGLFFLKKKILRHSDLTHTTEPQSRAKKGPQLLETAADPTKSAIGPGRTIQMAYHVPPLPALAAYEKKKIFFASTIKN